MKTFHASLLALAAASTLAAGEHLASITIQGAETSVKLVTALAKACGQGGGATIDVQGGGSAKAIKDCRDGKVPLAFSTRDLKPEETQAGLVATAYALDANVIIVNKNNSVEELSIEQLRDIYSGKTDKWPDGSPVTALNHPEGSGSRDFFQSAVLGKDGKFGEKVAVKHPGVLPSTVAKVPSAIAYTSIGEADVGAVKVLKINGVAPTAENIRGKSYPLSRSLFFVTKGAPSGEAKVFVDYVLSEPGQAVVAQQRFVPLK